MGIADKVQITRSWLMVALTALLLSCGGSGGSGDGAGNPRVAYTYRQPAAIGDGWRVAHGRDVGVDVAPLETLVNNIREDAQDFRFIDSVFVAKDGRLVLDEQFRTGLDFTDEWAGNRNVNLHVLNSVTKSFTSTLIGIAIDQGQIPGVQVPVHDYFQQKFPIAEWSAAKAGITLQDWLTMRHGYDWNEWSSSYFDAGNINARMIAAADPVQFLLDRPLASTPGEVFAYSTGVSYGLGRLLQQASGQDVANYLRDNLLTPLDIRDFTYWNTDGQLQSGSGLYLATRDMAKLGQLFLDGGVWNGTRVVSQSWVTEATVRRVELNGRGYGYQWWMREYTVGGNSYQTFYADGLGGQYIFVFPELNTVVAFTGSVYEDGQAPQRNFTRVIEEFILPAVL
jgi:CubicO group peptidase (beta-lactamase class C family)